MMKWSNYEDYFKYGFKEWTENTRINLAFSVKNLESSGSLDYNQNKLHEIKNQAFAVQLNSKEKNLFDIGGKLLQGFWIKNIGN